MSYGFCKRYEVKLFTFVSDGTIHIKEHSLNKKLVKKEIHANKKMNLLLKQRAELLQHIKPHNY